jgi:hypothetical protein
VARHKIRLAAMGGVWEKRLTINSFVMPEFFALMAIISRKKYPASRTTQ